MNNYALLSVSDKTGIVEFAKELKGLGFDLIGSLKTAKLLRENNIAITEASEITGYPAIMGTQGIKLIHPKIFGGILADKANLEHLKDLKKYKINAIDLLVCNFYPFKEAISKKGHKHEDVIFNLDIGGPSMVRCAAKNYKNVAVITDIADYKKILMELKQTGEISLETKEKLSLKAFEYVHKYNEDIINYLKNKFN